MGALPRGHAPHARGPQRETTPEDLLAAEREAIALLDPEVERAERAFGELGLEFPAVDSSGGGDDPTP